MEKLWEHAIQMLLQRQIAKDDDVVALHPMRQSAIQLFHDGGPKLDPDIIIYRGGTPFSVVDAKYSLASSPSADDVYQLTCYVSRFQADNGLLAYVAEDNQTILQPIGTLESGARLFACFISLDAFSKSRVAIDSISPFDVMRTQVSNY
jgi:5-methylcytosine-specific restriction endonuclease McrBC regulatory subunit McrC